MIYEWVVVQLLPEEEVGQNKLRKRTIILEEAGDSQYKWWLAVDFFNDKIDMIASLKTGEAVKVYLNAKTREYNGKWYNSITGRRIEPLDGSAPAESNDQQSDEELFPF
mgnify:CR=1 FL=1